MIRTMRDRGGGGAPYCHGAPPPSATHSGPLPPAAVTGPGGRLSPPQGPYPVTLISPCVRGGAAQLKLISRLTSCCTGNFRRVEVTCTHLCCSPSATCVVGRCGGGCPCSAGCLPWDLSPTSQALGSKGRRQVNLRWTKWTLREGTCQESSPGNSPPSRRPLSFPEWVWGWCPGTAAAPVCSAVVEPFPSTPSSALAPLNLPGACKPAGSRWPLRSLLFLS